MGETTLDLTLLDATFGAVVRGVDVRTLENQTWKAVRQEIGRAHV